MFHRFWVIFFVGTMEDKISLLRSIPRQKWRLQEQILCEKLEHEPAQDASQREQLTAFIRALSNGYSGSKREKNQKRLSCGIVDLKSDSRNKLGVYCRKYGDRVIFPPSLDLSRSNKPQTPRKHWRWIQVICWQRRRLLGCQRRWRSVRWWGVWWLLAIF